MKHLQKQSNRAVNLLFSIAIAVTVVFLFMPLLFQWFPGLEEMVRRFLAPLGREGYKSSYVESLGALIGTFLAITGALWTQAYFDKEADRKKETEEEKALQVRFITVYYDLKLAFEDMKSLYAGFFAVLAVPGSSQMEEFRKLAETFHLYIDNAWIEHVSFLGGKLEPAELQEIFLIYGDICSLERYITSPQKNEYMTMKAVELLGKYFEADKSGQVILKQRYKEILERLRMLAGIKDTNS